MLAGIKLQDTRLFKKKKVVYVLEYYLERKSEVYLDNGWEKFYKTDKGKKYFSLNQDRWETGEGRIGSQLSQNPRR